MPPKWKCRRQASTLESALRRPLPVLPCGRNLLPTWRKSADPIYLPIPTEVSLKQLRTDPRGETLRICGWLLRTLGCVESQGTIYKTTHVGGLHWKRSIGIPICIRPLQLLPRHFPKSKIYRFDPTNCSSSSEPSYQSSTLLGNCSRDFAIVQV